MSILPNATNVQITGGHFSAFGAAGSRSQGLDLIRDHSALDALLNSSERYDPPRCDEDTRIAIIKEIVDWIDNKEKSASMMVLHGPAGAGKSALEQSIAEIFSRRRRLAASFFFSRTAPSRSDGNSLIPTLVYQLAQLSPDFRKSISKVVIQDPGVLKMNRQKQMETLFVEPLWKRPWWKRLLAYFPWNQNNNRLLIVVDGLDECSDPEIQCDLLQVIACAIPLLPFPFRFLVASRPESHIMHTLDHNPHLQSIRPRRIDLAKDLNAEKDIKRFLLKEFNRIRQTHPLRHYLAEAWPSSEDIAKLVGKASSQFIYVATVMKYVRSRKHRPDERLKTIICLSYSPIVTADKPLAQLDALYAHIFSCVNNIELVLRIFGVLYLSANQEKEFGLEAEHITPTRLEEIFCLKPGGIQLVLDELLSIIDFSDRKRPIKIFHASLFDFLLDESRSGPFVLDLQQAHEALALSCFLTISGTANAYAHEFDVRKRISAACRFWKHCRYTRALPAIRECVKSHFLLPFHSTLIAKHALVRVLGPVGAVRAEWAVMDALDTALSNKDLFSGKILLDLVEMATSHIQSLMLSSDIHRVLLPFQPYFSDALGRKELPIFGKVVITRIKFSLLLRSCLRLMSDSSATYPTAVMASSDFWSKDVPEDLVHASALLAATLLPLSAYYQPLVDLLASSANVAYIFGSVTAESSTPVKKAILAYLNKYPPQINRNKSGANRGYTQPSIRRMSSERFPRDPKRDAVYGIPWLARDGKR